MSLCYTEASHLAPCPALRVPALQMGDPTWSLHTQACFILTAFKNMDGSLTGYQKYNIRCQGSKTSEILQRKIASECEAYRAQNSYEVNHGSTNIPAAAESLQLCPTLCDPIDSSPPGSPVPGILQARTLEWVAISLHQNVKATELRIHMG